MSTQPGCHFMNNTINNISEPVGHHLDTMLDGNLFDRPMDNAGNSFLPGDDHSSAIGWAIEYSHSEHSFHIGRTNDMLRRNINSVREGEELDFICVGIFSSRELAEDAILEFRRNRDAMQTLSFL